MPLSIDRNASAWRRLVRSARLTLVIALMAATLGAAPAGAHPVAFWLFAKAFGIAAGTAGLTQWQADRAYAKASRAGTCSQRRERLLHVLPDALRYGRYARDIYDHGGELKSDAPTTVALEDGGTGFFDPQGQRYAEVHLDTARNEAIVVFRGTRLTVRGDISADALNAVGIETGYYRWASDLVARVVREHAGMRIVATGHSLGGGLVLYAVLRNPGVEGVAFDPAGLSWLTWLATSRADRARANAALTVVSARNSAHVEPLTALSLAHRTVLPGTLYFAEIDVLRPLLLHSMTRLVSALERMSASGADGTACNGVIAPLAH